MNEKRKVGRPRSQMTDKGIEAILRGIRLGLHPERAAQAAGVNVGAFKEFKKTHPEFLAQIKEAEAKAQESFLSRILLHTEKQWTAAAWILERRWPEAWAKREPTVEVKVAQQQAIQVGPPVPGPDQLREMLLQLSDRLQLQLKNAPKIENK